VRLRRGKFLKALLVTSVIGPGPGLAAEPMPRATRATGTHDSDCDPLEVPWQPMGRRFDPRFAWPGSPWLAVGNSTRARYVACAKGRD
jgi:hypothetical protein